MLARVNLDKQDSAHQLAVQRADDHELNLLERNVPPAQATILEEPCRFPEDEGSPRPFCPLYYPDPTELQHFHLLTCLEAATV